ncbi:Butyrophilin subfamily 1 member A1 [Myotis davidii]|uniref:Butyrophilin subfamily 1 member A1 n=1 Tax=Myotis davidii TaxID=225400 RepID=L5LW38_MYODS|nr:Butyrophilin subfamily 1 member A1 [Myotis davidii]
MASSMSDVDKRTEKENKVTITHDKNCVAKERQQTYMVYKAEKYKNEGKFQAHGPDEALVAMLGGDAELPCFLMHHQSIKNMKISWTRSLPSQVVHLYEDGRDKPEETMEEYYGRTELVKNVMNKGIVVLRIFNVRPSDSGQYRCAFQHGSFYSDTVIELKVAALGSHPQFHVEVTKSSQLRLECKSEGWFPLPKVQWMDSEGGEIPAQSETHTQDKGGLFHVTTSLVLREPSQKNLTCSVWNPVLNQKKEEQLSIAEGTCSSPPGTAPAAQDHNTSPDQDGASANPPGAALHNAAPKATNAEAACTYPPGAAWAEAHDTFSSSASKAFAKVRLFFKYDPEKKAELRDCMERFTGLSMGPYLQVSRELSCVNSQISCSSAQSPGSTTPMQSRHPLENLSTFNKNIVSHLEPRGAVPAQ